ncbi:MAG TPA: site-specific tyrosine recombinase/integron integrase [Candidatus Babeliales bacterium]|nr:site-specific tyrosine recombinase/integron integrase [Candidatus Babeliales bacterium]
MKLQNNNNNLSKITAALLREKLVEFLVYLDVEKNLSRHTYRAYQSDLEQLLDFWEQTNQAKKFELNLKQALELFLVHMFNKKIDKNSISRKISCFKSFEKFLQAQDINLNINLTRPKLNKKLPIYLTPQEINEPLDKLITGQQNLQSSTPLRDLAILELLYATGMRCSELTSIRLAALELEQKTVRVIGKGNKERIVLFGDKAKLSLENYLKTERPKTTRKDAYLFINPERLPLAPRTIQRIVERFRKLLKIPRPITPHKLRHSFATHMLNSGADLRVVQELLGHKSLSSTEKYTHLTTTELAEMCQNLHPINQMVTDQE